MTLKSDPTSYGAFRDEWLQDIADATSTVEKGRLFAIRLARDWLDVDPNEDDFYYVDGSGDGGIDVAYLQRSSEDDHDAVEGQGLSERGGDTWYLFQSKYGVAIHAHNVIANESTKVFERELYSSLAKQCLTTLGC